MGALGDTSLSNEDWTELFRLMQKINKNYPDYDSQALDLNQKAKERGFAAVWNEFKECVFQEFI